MATTTSPNVSSRTRKPERVDARMSSKRGQRPAAHHKGGDGQLRPTSERGNKRVAQVAPTAVNKAQVEELLLQALETEMGGIQVYQTAIACAQNPDLRKEWNEYLEQTRNHEKVVRLLCERYGVDAEKESPGRLVVRHLGESIVEAMRKAQATGNGDAAQLVAAECVVMAETKDHQNWELIGEVANSFTGDAKAWFKEAHDEVEDEEDEHLYHTMGWSRELWLQSLGLPAVLPPPEEEKAVKTAIGAAKAKASRKEMLPKTKVNKAPSKKKL